ncbi:MAG TPA: hypothetical protein VKW06_04765 [Candidatus Angelobacter sp.]|nr:hypothetical protein [Candidatus Angelobacter sp.]
MHAVGLRAALAVLLIASIVSCGGNSSNPVMPTVVTVSFGTGAPVAAAAQMGAGTFSAVPIQGSQISVTLPPGTTRYAIAYVCPPRVLGTVTDNSVFVIEATVQDGSALNSSCVRSVPAMASVTGTVDATAIAGATQIAIAGRGGFGSFLSFVSGPFNVSVPSGTNDIAILALDSSRDVLAVKILRSQTVPGAVNAGGTVVLGAADMTVNQPFTVTNVPAGFGAPVPFVEYRTTGETSIFLKASSTTQYPPVPAASTQPGDFYTFQGISSNSGTPDSAIGLAQTTTSGGGPVTLTLPAPWPATAPAPAALPTFTFNYPGFPGVSEVVESAELTWFNSTLSVGNAIRVTATSAFQNGSNTITVPDLSSLPGFLGAPPSGTNLVWMARIDGSTQILPFSGTISPNLSLPNVANEGTLMVP